MLFYLTTTFADENLLLYSMVRGRGGGRCPWWWVLFWEKPSGQRTQS